MTDAGSAQARRLAEQLCTESIAAIYSSPRLRTRQTAGAIAALRGVAVQVVDALDEIDFGEWTGCRFEELDGRPEWDLWNSARSRTGCPGGENMVDAQRRALDFLRTAARQHEGQLVAVVTHCDIIRALLCWRDGRSLDAILDYEAGPASTTPFSLGPSLRAAA